MYVIVAVVGRTLLSLVRSDKSIPFIHFISRYFGDAVHLLGNLFPDHGAHNFLEAGRQSGCRVAPVPQSFPHSHRAGYSTSALGRAHQYRDFSKGPGRSYLLLTTFFCLAYVRERLGSFVSEVRLGDIKRFQR